MCDLMVLAFQGDQTRISTLMFANEGSNKSYAFMDVPEGHHDLSHHGGDKAKHEKIKKINRFHLEQFARMLGRMKAIREGNGSLLDHTMIVYGSGIGDGDRHNHNDLPILVAGRGGERSRPVDTSSIPKTRRSTTSSSRFSTAWARPSTASETVPDAWQSWTVDAFASVGWVSRRSRRNPPMRCGLRLAGSADPSDRASVAFPVRFEFPRFTEEVGGDDLAGAARRAACSSRRLPSRGVWAFAGRC